MQTPPTYLPSLEEIYRKAELLRNSRSELSKKQLRKRENKFQLTTKSSHLPSLRSGGVTIPIINSFGQLIPGQHRKNQQIGHK
jgi:hypothetical protein